MKEKQSYIPKRVINEQAAQAAQWFGMGMDSGCDLEQLKNFFKAGMFLQPKQLEMSAAARACDKRCPACQAKYDAGRELPVDCPDCGPIYVGVGGARGGGKSAWLFAQICLDDCQRYPGLKFLYARKTLSSAREQIRDLLLKTCRNTPHNYREQAGIIEFPNGSYVIIKHFKDEKDIDGFLGQEYDGIAVEELTTFSYDKWKNLMTCLRTSKPGWRPRFYAAWNWGGIGHFWTMNTFYIPYEQKRERQTRYILARVDDNKHNNPEYVNTLKSLTGWKYQSWYLGDPHFQAGQFFTMWNPSWHVYPNAHVAFNENDAVRWAASLDYGFSHPSCFLLHCIDKAGNSYTVDEEHHQESVIEENAEFFKAMLRRHKLEMSELDYIAAGRDCFSRKQDGRTIAMDYADNGIELVAVEIDRVNAWAVMQQKLGDPAKGINPTWFIHEKCKNLIAQIPLAQNHEKRAGDIEKMNADENGEGGDDSLESARNYLVAEPGRPISFAMPMALGHPLTMIGG